ncbi:MAG: CRISPR-associated helicase Cas3' [Candidatus Freyarchaeota archaeon]|nr:CRISPR-associated helicase Cas3' [Candidatus Jordarchaeia archaeon]
MSDGSLRSKYDEVCRALEGEPGWKPRLGVSRVLEKLDSLLGDGENSVVLMEYPAGYGKSAMTLALAKAAVDGNQFFSRVIHVLPMRTIADELGQRLRGWLEKLKYDSRVVGVQHMGSPGSPFFAKRCVVVTLDTFLLNFYKAPAYELAKLFKYDVSHYEFPRGNIYSSLVVFDEFHLLSPTSAGEFSSLEEEAKALCTTTRAIIQMASVGVPVVIMTATMPKTLKEFLRRHVKNYGIRFEEEVYSPMEDKQFEDERRKKRIKLTIWEGDIAEAATNYCRQGKRTLIVLNTVKVAVEVYQALKKHFTVILLHGRLPESVRKDRTEKLGKAKVLVATQVVEAGIDESFDVLVSEVCPPDRLLQRMGRVARKEGHNEGEVVVVKQVSNGVYNSNVIDATWSFLASHKEEKFRSRSEVEDSVRAMMAEVYGEEHMEELEQQFVMLKLLLGDLDAYPFLTARDAKKFIEAIGGLTSSFGIISAFAAEDVRKNNLKNAVGLSEGMARKALKHGANVVKDGRIIVLEEGKRDRLLSEKNLSLALLRRGYEGIVVDEIDQEVGYVGVDG